MLGDRQLYKCRSLWWLLLLMKWGHLWSCLWWVHCAWSPPVHAWGSVSDPHLSGHFLYIMPDSTHHCSFELWSWPEGRKIPDLNSGLRISKDPTRALNPNHKPLLLRLTFTRWFCFEILGTGPGNIKYHFDAHLSTSFHVSSSFRKLGERMGKFLGLSVKYNQHHKNAMFTFNMHFNVCIPFLAQSFHEYWWRGWYHAFSYIRRNQNNMGSLSTSTKR